ncbi:nuclear RNA export factor 1-like isoform X2 [Microplitis mediator]|uniref:nuclear RNA export factor 1-like isoform X2 n=1 Tax=Microplitis mediator TaxID=375433 RepID=UPI00255566FE|nr:nuclear RNA export factor 1-like isoform X2 [Microplitis mediator]
MSSKQSKSLNLTIKDRNTDYLKIVKKESVDFHYIIHESTCSISEQRFPISSLKRSHPSRRSKLLPIIKKKSDKSFNSFQVPDNYGWYKVTYRETRDQSIFYVDEEEIANKLAALNEKIKTSDNYRIKLNIEKGFPEHGIEKFSRRLIKIDDTLSKKLKYVASKRLCGKTKTLDLSHFHCDPYLADDYFCALFIPNIFSTIMKFVFDYMPDLRVLDLRKNNLRLSSTLATVILRFSHLKIIYLNDNLIKNLNGLSLLKNLKLEELYLCGNPLRGNNVQNKKEYFEYIRMMFPSLLVLDGFKVSKPIVIDLEMEEEEERNLPMSLKNFYSHVEVQKIAGQFIKKYFAIFDSDSREPLLSLYHKLAFFSMTVSSATPTSHESRNIEEYVQFHRNLITMKVADQRINLLKQGRLPIVTLISLLPETYHYLNSFSTDVMLQTDGTMMICISGCFKELNTNGKLMFYFNRTFIIKLEADDCMIINDQLYLSYPTPKQKEQALDNFGVIESKLLITPKQEAQDLKNFSIVRSSAPSPTSSTAVTSNPLPPSTPISSLITPPPTPVLLTANTDPVNSTSSSEIFTEPTIKSEPLSPPPPTTPELELTYDIFKEKLTSLGGIIRNCLSAIDGFLNDEEIKKKFD